MNIGFSTGCLYRNGNDAKTNIKILKSISKEAIEITFLKDPDLTNIKDLISLAEDSDFDFISIHGPKVFNDIPHEIIVDKMLENISPWYHITMHPDTIYSKRNYWWNALSTQICVENMDHRLPEFCKPDSIKLNEILGPPGNPRFSFCLDIAHTYFVDPSMTDLDVFLKLYRKSSLKQYHISEININGDHNMISEPSSEMYKVPIYDLSKPFIIETAFDNTDDLKREYDKVRSILENTKEFNCELST